MNKAVQCDFCGKSFTVIGERPICPCCGTPHSEIKPCEPPKAEKPAEQKPDTAAVAEKYSDILGADNMHKLALCKYRGIGMEKDEAEAFKLFRIAAERGNAEAQFYIGECFENGRGTKVSLSFAAMWYKSAAENGYERATLVLRQRFPLAYDKLMAERPKAAEDFSQFAQKSLRSVVKIKSTRPDGKIEEGAGFIVDGGLVITNAHVVADIAAEKVYENVTASFDSTLDGQCYTLTVMKCKKEQDLALCVFAGLAAKRFATERHLRLCEDAVGFGESVYTIGNPMGVGLSVTKGVVSNPCRMFGEVEMIQTDISANPGSSGGGVFNKTGDVVAVMTAIDGRASGGVSFCLPAKYIKECIAKYKNAEVNG